MAYLRLTMDPLPAGSRFATLARLLPPSQWDAIRRSAYRRAGYRCEVCGSQARLHCHEVWQCSPETGYQWLRGFQALCPLCHDTKHAVFARDPPRRAEVLQHFARVNGTTLLEAEEHLRQAIRRQRELDQRQWTISYGDHNFAMPALRDLEQRRQYARALRPRSAFVP